MLPIMILPIDGFCRRVCESAINVQPWGNFLGGVDCADFEYEFTLRDG